MSAEPEQMSEGLKELGQNSELAKDKDTIKRDFYVLCLNSKENKEGVDPKPKLKPQIETLLNQKAKTYALSFKQVVILKTALERFCRVYKMCDRIARH